ncbi:MULTISPECIES: hypothetical protein [Xanthomonas]|nr:MULTISPECIES: hypothetical protein [Xanthomonas]KNX93991.1 hypothetical protein NX05_22475 [Xanthomonas vasicola]MBV6799936.1 hypothetical protein [Xanthomonas campestris pv. obscurae]MCC8549048.1 hypothetical protein [Xanthomonas perforans]MCC8562533.1 hypothetical protein [Xanthomonas perforans]MDC9654666.1 hypothetical protein [Xanthomonas perforans]
MKNTIRLVVIAVAVTLVGCGERATSVPDRGPANGTIPGDAVIPIFEKLGLPDKCKQVGTFDQTCANQIDSAYGIGAGDDARIKLKTCRAYGNCGDKRGSPAKSTVPPAKTSF